MTTYIYTDNQHLAVNTENTEDLIKAMEFKARHMKAKAEPQLFEAIAEKLKEAEKEGIKKGRAEALNWVHGAVMCAYCDASDICCPGKQCQDVLLEKMQQEVDR